MPVEVPLQEGFRPGMSLMICGFIHDEAERFVINLLCRRADGSCNIAFHFNPRFDEGVVVQNSRKALLWDAEIRSRSLPFQRGVAFEMKIICQSDSFSVTVNNTNFTEFAFRDNEYLSPVKITHVQCHGDVNILKIQYSADQIIIDPQLMFWRQIEGHLKKVETAAGVTWGIGFDNTPWFFSGNVIII